MSFYFSLIYLVVDCGDPGSVSNGVRIMSATTYLSTAKYFCHPGYKLLGSPERVCEAEGQWSGQATSCVSKSSNIIREFAKSGRQRQPERHLEFRKASLVSVRYL